VASSATSGPAADALVNKETLTKDDLLRLSSGALQQVKTARTRQQRALKDEIELTSVLSDYLCQQLRNLRQTCPIMNPLIPDPSSQALTCTDDRGSAPLAAPLKVTIPPNKNGEFVLIANDLYVSSVFSAGTSEITFASTGARNIAAPKFSAIWKLVLRSKAGKDVDHLLALPQLNGFSLTLAQGASTLLNTQLEPSHDERLRQSVREYRVNLASLSALAQSSTCRIPGDEIDAAEKQLSQGLVDRQHQLPTSAVDQGDIKASILSLQTDIQQSLLLLDAAKNRHYQLRSELNPDTAIGCQAGSPITKLEVHIDGSLIDRAFISQQDDPLASRNGNKSAGLAIDFGGFGFRVDLLVNNILRIKYVPKDDFSQHSIRDIQRVVLTKLGTKIDNIRECKKDLLIFDTCIYSSYEENTLSINKITIWVNDILLYESGVLGKRLDRSNPALSLYNVQQNDAWVRLMQREDCQVTH
jgi:hypothetical protein